MLVKNKKIYVLGSGSQRHDEGIFIIGEDLSFVEHEMYGNLTGKAHYMGVV